MVDFLSPCWRPGPRRPRVDARQVDVWRVDLPHGEAPAQAIAAGQPRAPRRIAQTASQTILAAYLACAPGEIEFARAPGGKPYLDRPDPSLRFNLSHSAGVALLAVAHGCEVGVDVETLREIDDPLRLARRVMSADEIAELDALPAARRNERFFVLWTRLEARQKAFGRGIFGPAVRPDGCSMFSFAVGTSGIACLALAVPEPAFKVRFFDWPGR